MAVLEVVISEGQSLLDVCIQQAGTLDAIFLLAEANGLSITDPLTAGQRLSLEGIEPNEIANYFEARKIRINTHTDFGAEGGSPALEGIYLVDGDGAAIVDFDEAFILVE